MMIDLALTGRAVLIAGGGEVAARRARLALDAGAAVTVVAPSASAEIAAWAAHGALRWETRAVTETDLDGAWLVIAATDDPAVNDALAAAAEARRVYCVHAGDAGRGSARIPAQGAAGDLTVAVASRGDADPARVRAVRDALIARVNEGEVDLRSQRPRAGRVILVGAGPGAPDLVTLRGARALAAADVIVHDRLGTEEILARVPQGAELIDVGKKPDHHPVPQEQINAILIEHARAGKTVVRLKGGDPFVLGRGGEEVQACALAGVPVEVVPGLTSAVSGPASALIPVTHRGTAASFHVTSGHEGLTDAALAAIRGGTTLVVLMGVAALPQIASAALAAGADPSIPVAWIENATTRSERVVRATLGTAIEVAERESVSNPAVLVIGAVAADGLLTGREAGEASGT